MCRYLIALPALLLAACASTPTAYAPSARGEPGYHDSQIENDRFRVGFTGGPDVSVGRVEDLALRRAAEVTLQAGDDWFEVIGRDRHSRGDRDSPVSVGGSVGQSFGGRGYRGSSVGLGVSFNSGRVRRTTVSLDILTGDGPRPDGPDFYDAHDVIANVPPL
ncbi:CC0125/CC1285 family lipoprotein [Hyphobacterium marinum]|uniref:Lipoprotein n=1 Tax=Hyphobacterium marinum TaxID=3116574 RepID=A0ABU7LZY4_9PROT|nr:hypothetical protein [Hyphobacterium sp. Y6023]MEE2567103.1 hypothetical protein [Hyphobacterium sp. Y6023]